MSGDLTAAWEELLYKSPLRVISTNVGNLRDQLEYICETAAFDLATELHRKGDELARLAPLLTRAILNKWYEVLKKQNLTGLVEIILEDQALSEAELKQFISSLPDLIIARIVESTAGSANGVQALIIVEACMRGALIDDYTIERDNGRILLTFRATDANSRTEELKFYLDEAIDLNL